jgi:sugar O-acyltransferase (sialic acid O-acetyltransferase NeuD family)
MSSASKKSIYLVACGGHGRVVLDALISSKQTVSGIIDAKLEPGSEIFGVKVLGDDSYLQNLDPLSTTLINGLGSTGNTRGRIELFERFSKLGFKFYGVVHPGASVGAECKIDQSAQIMAGVVLQNRVEVGKNVVINTRSSIDHDVVISEHTVVSPGAIISGSVKIGRGAFVGAGAVIIQGIKIGEGCVIGAGAVVRHHVTANTTVVGNPAAQLE